MDRLKIVFFAYLIVLSIIIFRLFYLQVISPNYYTADYTQTDKIEPIRGKIFDINNLPFAVNQTKYLLYAEPKKITNKEYVVNAIDGILQIGEATISGRINMERDWVAIKSGVSDDLKNKIEELKIPSLGFQEEQYRFYPESSLAAHLIGFLGKDDDGLPIGYFGVEGFYNKDLAGLPGIVKSERDLLGRPILIGTQEHLGAEDGRNFKLTVDKSLQLIVKDKLVRAVEKYKAVQGCVIMVKPQTMAIMALSCVPDFDPENYYKYNSTDYANWLISSSYEPGSTFKPLVLASAIEEKVLSEKDTFNEDAPVQIGNYTIRNWNDKYDGNITYKRVIEKSSNVGMVKIGEKLGKEKLNEYISNKYLFGQTTGIDLQGEARGTVKKLSTWYPIDAATVTFGQGISVTGLQLVTAFASLINGGYLMQPYVTHEVTDSVSTKTREPQVRTRILSQRTSDIMKEVLVSTVQNAEAKWRIPQGFTFGGKTGTAQIAVDGKYDATKTIASFIGFAPADDPAFLMLVVIRQPEVSSWGSETAAPLFFDIAREILLYLNITPR
jgi:cell division protein FtsI/penicillin-binding protein 2